MNTHYAVIAFDRSQGGGLIAGERMAAPSIGAATRKALELSFKHVGALAFRRAAASGMGTPGEVEVVAAYGEVEAKVLLGGESSLTDR